LTNNKLVKSDLIFDILTWQCRISEERSRDVRPLHWIIAHTLIPCGVLWCGWSPERKHGSTRVMTQPVMCVTAGMADACLHCVIYKHQQQKLKLPEFTEFTAEQLLPGQAIQSAKAGCTDRPSQYKSHLRGHSPPAKLGRTMCWDLGRLSRAFDLCGGPGRPLRYRKRERSFKLSAYGGERTSVGIHLLWIELICSTTSFTYPVYIEGGHLL
jgi:hypothetical protein